MFAFLLFDFIHLPFTRTNNYVATIDHAVHQKWLRHFAWIVIIMFIFSSIVSFRLSAKRARFFEFQRSIASISQLSWQQFEHLVAEAYRRAGYRVTVNAQNGADGGIDLILKKSGKTTLVQCKRWKSSKVGVAVVREMYGLLLHHSADYLKIVCVGEFTAEAKAFTHGKPIELVTGDSLMHLVHSGQKHSS